MSRPAELPEYENPPLNEIVMGVQFAPPKGYKQIYSREVWALFEKDFPLVEEHQPLPPSLESFDKGGRNQISFGLMQGAMHDRFWFLSTDKDELLQFQNDRFLHNWRKIGDGDNAYPRFDNIISDYQRELSTLESYFSIKSKEELKINQCELNYINHIPMKDQSTDKIDKWIKLLNIESMDLEDLSVAFRKVLKRSDGSPYGRLSCDGSTGFNKSNEEVFVLNITVKGMTEDTGIKSAIDFLKNGRNIIVDTFDKITTKEAHTMWRKK